MHNYDTVQALSESNKYEFGKWPLEYLGKPGRGNSEQFELSELHASHSEFHTDEI